LILPVNPACSTDSSPLNSVGVIYTGDSNYSFATQTVCVTIIPTLTVSPNPAVYGQGVTYSSTVFNPAVPSNITSVGFADCDCTPILVAVKNGQATYMPPVPLPVSTNRSVQASAYIQTATGTNVPIAYSNLVNLVINKANTATGLTLSQNGTNATLTATVAVVAPGAGTPTGTLSFLSGGKVLANAPLSGGAAVFAASNFSGTVTAMYSGDGNFNGSTSSAVTVNPPPPPPPPTSSLSLSSSPNPSQFGQAVTFSASLTVSGSTATPGGSVQFLDGSTAIGSAPLSGGGASVTVSNLSVGSHGIAAQYSGDGIFPGASATVGQVVNRIASTLTLSVSPAQVNAGQSVTLTAQVGPSASGGIPAPGGQVTFSAGSSSLGSAAVSGGSEL
jgi:hypothetical protein